MCWNEGLGGVDVGEGSCCSLHGRVVLKLFKVAMYSVHELGELDRVYGQSLGQGTPSEQ